MADARADAVRVASEPDAWLARSLVITARQVVDDGRVLQSAAWSPLVALLEQSARGDLGRHEWRSAMHEALPLTPGTPARSVGQLMNDLAAAVPPGAHAVRVRRALDTGNRDARELVLLLQGALIAADATLQLELLAQLRALALAPLGILGLLQEPFLLRALDSVSATAADPDESAHTRHVLAAAELARRGDQRGARHGCVLIDGEGHVLGEGFNHEATTVAGGGRKRIVHAEAHALADAIRRRGDDGAWAACGSASAYIVELSGAAGYDDAPPCRKCELLLRAFGVRRAMHTTRDGRLCVRELGGGGVTAAGGCSRAGRPLLERAKWNLATSLQQSTWAGSAVLGGLIADRIGYRNTFLITAALHLVSVFLLAPLLCIVPASDESRRKAARGGGDGRRQPLLPAVEQGAESNPGSPGPVEQRRPQAATTAETAPASG